MKYYISQAVEKGVQIAYQTKVTGFERQGSGYRVSVKDVSVDYSFLTRRVINCAGLEADKVGKLAGIDIDKAGYRIHYCKGEYYSVGNGKNSLVQRLIYPVPSADLTGVGVHITLDLDRRMRFGPSAYHVDNLDYSINSRHKSLFYESVKAYLPEFEYEDIEPETTGIRPKVQGPGGDQRLHNT